MNNPQVAKKYNLQRYINAQEYSYNIALEEIKSGEKRSHWIWYIFPQQKGLGRSYNSEFYGLDGKEEARAYLNNPILGSRLREIAQALLTHKGQRTIRQLMGSGIDVRKLKNSMILFDKVSPNDVFSKVIEAFFSNNKIHNVIKSYTQMKLFRFGKKEEQHVNNRIYNEIARPMYTPERIKSLKNDEIFVFGSNLAGIHGGGAARAARSYFGAIMGQGVGLQGQSYAIPTMQGGVETIKPYVDEFIEFAKQHDESFFFVTRIGCGIAGFKDEDIAPLFANAVSVANICLPGSFVENIPNAIG